MGSLYVESAGLPIAGGSRRLFKPKLWAKQFEKLATTRVGGRVAAHRQGEGTRAGKAETSGQELECAKERDAAVLEEVAKV